MRHLEILEYSSQLSEAIDSESILPYSSEEEVVIRACTVIAVDRIL